LKPKSAAQAPESPERLKPPISSSNKISPRKAAEESKDVESTTKQGDPSQVSPYRPLKRKAATVLLPVKRMK
jgi:hypothetical protein